MVKEEVGKGKKLLALDLLYEEEKQKKKEEDEKFNI